MGWTRGYFSCSFGTIDSYLKAYNVPTDGDKDRSTPAIVSLMSTSAMMALLYLLTNVLVRVQWKREV